MISSSFQSELMGNRAAYERHREEIRHAAHGHYAAIAQGRLIVLSPTFDDAVAAVEQLRPCPEHFLVFPADEEPAFEVIDNFSSAV